MPQASPDSVRQFSLVDQQAKSSGTGTTFNRPDDDGNRGDDFTAASTATTIAISNVSKMNTNRKLVVCWFNSSRVFGTPSRA